MPQQPVALGTPAEQREALRRLEDSLGRVDRALRDLEKEREIEEELLRRHRQINPPTFKPRLPGLKPPGPWDFIGDTAFYLVFPGVYNYSGSGPCFESNCNDSFVSGRALTACNTIFPTCAFHAAMPPPPQYQTWRQAVAGGALVGGGWYWGEDWTRAGTVGTRYQRGKVYGPLDAGNPVTIGATAVPLPVPSPPPRGFAGAIVVDPNTIRPQTAEEPDLAPQEKPSRRDRPWRWRVTLRYVAPHGGVSARPVVKPKPEPKLGGPWRMPPPAPPRNKEKERKVVVKMTGLFAGASWLFDLYTESNDFVTAIWKALPSKYRCGEKRYGPKGNPYRVRVSPYRRKGDVLGKAEDLLNHWDEVDIGQALLNLAANQLEDHVIGKTQQQLFQLAGGKSSPTGHAGVINLNMALRQAKKDMEVYKSVSPKTECT